MQREACARVQKLKDDNTVPEPSCRDATEFAETNQVKVGSLTGLWLLLTACVALAAAMAVLEYFWWLRGSPEKRAVMRARALTLVACGRRGDPDAWARTESLRARAKQDLPPTARISHSRGGLTGMLRGFGRMRMMDDVGMSRAVAPCAAEGTAAPYVPRQPPIEEQRESGIMVSPRGLQAIIQCADGERGAEGDTVKESNGDDAPRGPGEICRIDTWNSDNGAHACAVRICWAGGCEWRHKCREHDLLQVGQGRS